MDLAKQVLAELSIGDWISILSISGILAFVFFTSNEFDRRAIVAPKSERVFIVGATSGIGKTIALHYAKRGAVVAIMGRRKAELLEVKKDCDAAGAHKTITVAGDFADVDVMTSARKTIEKEFGGLDTLIVSAGVSAQQPVITGYAKTPRLDSGDFPSVSTPTKANIQAAKDAANTVMTSNYIGPLVTATTFIPMLELSSKCPAVALISSAAAVIPPPSRSFYSASKGATLLLYEVLSIEHPKIKFTHVIPGTVEGVFRHTAVGGTTEHAGSDKGLSQDEVASNTITGIDTGARNVYLPRYYRLGAILYHIVPGWIEGKAIKKYNWKA